MTAFNKITQIPHSGHILSGKNFILESTTDFHSI